MSTHLDLADIQGNILRGYGRQKLPKARYFFVHFGDDAKASRRFVEGLRGKVTTATRWADDDSDAKDFQATAEAALELAGPHPARALKNLTARHYPGDITVSRPKVAINIAFTFRGLLVLGVPIRTLRGLPDEFIDGMAARASMLSDPGPGSPPGSRDTIWEASDPDKPGGDRIHALVMLNAQMNADTGKPVDALEEETANLRQLCAACGVRILPGHGPKKLDYQDASARMIQGADGKYVAIPKEHFDYTDGFGDPIFSGQFSPEAEKLRLKGRGKIEPGPAGEWKALATGEFLLGYPDEAQEIPDAGMPLDFSRNGTFMVYRKLHQNIKSFRDFIASSAKTYSVISGLNDNDKAEDLLKAKLVGRWQDGVPLEAAPTWQDWDNFNKAMAAAVQSGDQHKRAELALQYYDFKYKDDADGARCPVSAHMRRANTRDMLDPTGDLPDQGFSGSVLNNRRRILRRGLPYGATTCDDDQEHGIIFMAVCASLFRQFEFVQQQWMQYGLDFNVGNNTCPLIGLHGDKTRFVIPPPNGSKQAPFIANPIRNFVECRGGEYFFIPSMTALRMIGQGIVDPT